MTLPAHEEHELTFEVRLRSVDPPPQWDAAILEKMTVEHELLYGSNVTVQLKAHRVVVVPVHLTPNGEVGQ